MAHGWTVVLAVAGLALASALAGGVVYLSTRAATQPVGCGGAPYDYPGGPGATPLGTMLALGPISENGTGLDHWYNTTILALDQPLLAGDLAFTVGTGYGATVSPAVGWTVDLLNHWGAVIATYVLSPSATGWENSSALLAADDVISLNSTPSDLSGSGYTLILTATGDCIGGSVTASIP